MCMCVLAVSHLHRATGEVTDMTVESTCLSVGRPVCLSKLSALTALLDGDLQRRHALQLTHTHTYTHTHTLQHSYIYEAIN